VLETEPPVQQQQNHRRRRQPEQPVPDQDLGKAEELGVLLRHRRVAPDVLDRRNGERIQQRGQGPVLQPVGDLAREHVPHEQRDPAHVGGQRLPSQHRHGEEDRRGEHQVGQQEQQIWLQVRGRAERPEHLLREVRHERPQQQPQRNRRHQHRVHQERTQKPPAQIVQTSDGRGVEERVHARLHVPKRRVAEEPRRHQGAEDPEHRGDDRHDLRRVRVHVPAVHRVRHQERDTHQDERVHPGRRLMQPVVQLEAEDLPEAHATTSTAGTSERASP
jgi:hypothetical protein